MCKGQRLCAIKKITLTLETFLVVCSQKQGENMNELTTLKKASGIIHISRSDLANIGSHFLDMYNHMLAYAFNNEIEKTETHRMPLPELFMHLGKSDEPVYTRNTEYLNEGFKKIVTQEIRFNILGKSKNDWSTISTLLADVTIGGGYIEWSYSPKLRSRLAKPDVYAHIAPGHRWKNPYSQAVYEFCKDFAPLGYTHPREIAQIREIFGVKKDEYKLYKHLNYKVIKPTEKEINEKPDCEITIQAVPKRAGRKVEFINYFVRKRLSIEEQRKRNINPDTLRKKLSLIGVDQIKINRIMLQYAKDLWIVEDNICYSVSAEKTHKKKTGKNFDNLPGYVVKAIDNNYAHPK